MTTAARPHVTPRRPAGPRRARLLGAVAAVALVATACGGGPGSQEDFTAVLQRDGALTESEATCISDRVFERYGDDEDALGKLSAAPSMEFLDGPDGIAGFTDFFDSTVESCLEVGPGN